MKWATETKGIIAVWFAVVVICVAGTVATACPNIPPEAWIDGWPYRFVLAGQVATFNGDGYDPDGWITGYNWWIPGCSAIPGAVWSLYQRPLQVTFGTGHCSTYVYFWVQDDDGAYSETQYQRVYVLESFSMSCSQTVLAVGQPQALTLPADAVNWTQTGKVTLKVVSGADKVAIYSDSACQNRLWPPIVWAPARLLVPPEVYVKGTAPGSVQLRLDVGYAYSPTPDLTTNLDLTVVLVKMKIEKEGNTVIESANNYSENTTIRVTAVNAANGQTCPWFTGTVNIAEDTSDPDYVPIYSQHVASGAFLPSSITFAPTDSGVKTFGAKSLADPKLDGYLGPDPAKIVTTNYGVYDPEGYLIVPQWTNDLGQVHVSSSGDVYDWFEKRTEDIFDHAAGGDAAEVLSKVAYYMQGAIGQKGYAPYIRSAQTPIELNPHWTEMRLNISDDDYGHTCHVSMGPDQSHTLLHEARHCYQNYLTTVHLNQPDDDGNPSTPNNDDDGDWLVDYVPIAPNNFILDNELLRQMCYGDVSFSGDTEPDGPNHVLYEDGNWGGVLERDAEGFAARFYSSLP